MKQREKSPTDPTGAQLRIGDEWNAITIIARSQTHPLKAVCELVENALDAGAREVLIVRRRTRHDVYLEISDDGRGVPRNAEGQPDFGHIATHVCDSMKRHLASHERKGIHGEFGIGLLSFWSLGESLRMVSAGAGGKLMEMLLERGKRKYTVRNVRGQLSLGGTRVMVGPLLPATRNIVTGEKLQRYLSEELRDRIRNTGATVRVTDRVARKEFVVRPREFSGERLALPPSLSTAWGDVTVELYYGQSSPEQSGRGVAVCTDGTRVLRNAAELESLAYSPWTDGRIEGVLDYPAFHLAPGTRSGIVPDERLEAFLAAVREVEPAILESMAQREQAERDKASRDIQRQVHRAFVTALRELKSNEYLFFDIPEPKPAGGKPEGESAQANGDPLKVKDASVQQDDPPAGGESEPLLPLTPGPLASVRISPRSAIREPGGECPLSATARDAYGLAIEEAVEYSWRIVEGTGLIKDAVKGACTISSGQSGAVTIEVEARQNETCVTDQVQVRFLEQASDSTSKGLPSYRLEPEHGVSWRSRYDVKKNEIVINSAHRDFAASKATVAKHRRYIGKLYAKEVVLINFPHQSPGEVMERLIEITLRTEDVL
jgi:hypothetical protein